MYITGDHFYIVNDAGETVGINRRVLEHVEAQVYKAALRPNKFRSLLPVGSFGIPEWAETMAYDTLTESAEWKWAEWAGQGSDDLKSAEVKAQSFTMRLGSMRSMYEFTDREVLRARQMNMNLDTTKAEDVMSKAQTVLDEIAFKGSEGLTENALPVATTGIYGLANLPGVTPDTALEASDTKSWTDFISDAVTSGSVDDFTLAYQVIIHDVLEMEATIESNTKQNVTPDTLLMPLSLRKALKGLKHPYSRASLYDELLSSCQFINRFEFWHRLETAGGSNTRRLICYPRTDERVARMVIPKEPTPGTPFKKQWSTQVGLELVTGGVQTKMPEAVFYYDMPANAG